MAVRSKDNPARVMTGIVMSSDVMGQRKASGMSVVVAGGAAGGMVMVEEDAADGDGMIIMTAVGQSKLVRNDSKLVVKAEADG